MPSAGPQFQLNQFLQLQLQGEKEQVCAVVANFLQNQIVLRFPQLSGLPEGYQVGASLTFRYPTKLGLATGTTIIVDTCAPPRPGIVIDHPGSIQMVQQRRFFRVEVDFACVFSLLGGDDSAGKGREEYRAILRDISGGGVCIVTDRKLAKGDLLQLSITIPRQPSNTVSSGGMAGKSGGTPLRGGLRNITAPPAPATETIDVQGQVVHLADIPSEGWPLFATGVEFRQVSNRLEERLMTLVFDLQRSQCLRR